MTGPVAIPPLRASDAEREYALHVLREAAVAGWLSDDSFELRVDGALRARSRDELRSLLADLPRSRFVDRVERLALLLSDGAARLADAVRRPRNPRLPLPRDRTRAHVLGRHPTADLLLADPTVSRWHAQLEPMADGAWLLTDLGSTNGTLVNGWLLTGPLAVRAGDRVSFGLLTVVLSPR